MVDVVEEAGVVFVLNPELFVFLPDGDKGDADGGEGFFRFTSAGAAALGFLIGAPREKVDFLRPAPDEPTDGA